MSARPVIDRLAVSLPTFSGSGDIWPTLIELAHSDHPEWTLIGGQMVMLHVAEHAALPLRVSRDIDVLVNARVLAGGVRGFVVGIESRGFRLAGASPHGIAHRYVRGTVSIDVLAPEGLGPRTDLTTTPPGRTIQAPGGTQALARTELVPVEYAGAQALLPRPSLLGAIVVKAAAAVVDDAPRAQEQDLALLLSLVPDPAEMTMAMTDKDRTRLRRVGIDSAAHPVWDALEPEAADRARLALHFLASTPAAGSAGVVAYDAVAHLKALSRGEASRSADPAQPPEFSAPPELPTAEIAVCSGRVERNELGQAHALCVLRDGHKGHCRSII